MGGMYESPTRGMATASVNYGISSNMQLFPRLARSARFYFQALVLIAGALLIAVPHQANGGTINARSPALVDVTTAIALAKDGDTVIVPAGTAHWTSRLSIAKGITLQGASSIAGAGTKTATAHDATNIIDDNVSSNASDLISVTLVPSQNFRVTGFTFTKGTGYGIMVHLQSFSTAPHLNMRVDHCHFVNYVGRAVQTDGWVYGVADHNYMQAQAGGYCFFINCATYGAKTSGHGAWADYPWFGTNKFFFMEDNTMVGNGITTTSGATDADHGARFVMRHNDFTNCRPGWHGTETGGRGCRAVEVYNNAFHWTLAPSSSNRSGTALYHDNTWDGQKSNNGSHSSIVVYREWAGVSVNCPYGFADGACAFDENDTEGNGTFVDGHAPHLFDNGKVSAGSLGSFTDSSKNWTPNQWAGFSVKQANTSAASYPKGSYIISNTQNTITYAYYGSGDRGPTLNFVAGDSYKIYKLLAPLDQVGRGKGDLLSGSGPVTNTVSGHTWPHQALEPAMSWNNVHSDGTAYGFATSFPTEKQGRDYYNLGKGLSTNGAPAQVRSIYTAALNGTAYTGPYTYPHPLVSGSSPGPAAPAPPTSLQVVPGP